MHMPISLGIFLCKMFTETLTPLNNVGTKETVETFPIFIQPQYHTITHTKGFVDIVSHKLAPLVDFVLDCVLALPFRQLHPHPLITNNSMANAVVVE
jgi:hypothetical protein